MLGQQAVVSTAQVALHFLDHHMTSYIYGLLCLASFTYVIIFEFIHIVNFSINFLSVAKWW